MEKILVLDDDPQLVDEVSILLDSFGYTSFSLLEPNFFFKMLETESFDLILLDVFLPGIDGLKLLKQLKENPKFKNIPVIMLTGDQDKRILADCFKLGAVDFINKPLDEITLKARIQSALGTQNYIRQLKRLNEQMHKDLLFAADVQNATMRSQKIVPFLTSSILYIPCAQVSGDIYHMSVNREGAQNVFLGDATGHGTASALLTMMVKSALSSIDSNLRTDETLYQLNQLIVSCRIPEHLFISGIYLRIDSNGLLTFSNAGHVPLVIIPEDQKNAVILNQNGFVLGIFDEKKINYDIYSYQLKQEDKVIVYTDGITECFRGKEIFGLPRFVNFLEENRHSEPQKILDDLLEYLNSFSKNQGIQDDLTILCFQFRDMS